MAALDANDWTVTLERRRIEAGGIRRVTGTLALAGTDTYPDLGIPLPPIGKFGFKRKMLGLTLFGVDATAGTTAEYHARLNKAAHKLFLFEEEASAAGGPLLECDTSEVPGARTWDFEAWGF